MRAWRRLHWATYGVFALATVHGLAAGTDTPDAVGLRLYVAAVGSVVFATAWRALNRPVSTTTKGGTHVPRSDRPLTV